MGYAQNKTIFFSEITKRDHKLSKTTFSLIKISQVDVFWLSYECFSVLHDALLLKSVISIYNNSRAVV